MTTNREKVDPVRPWHIITVILLAVTIGYLGFWPVDIDPVQWTSPKNPPLEGRFQVNQELKGAEKLLTEVGTGPEEIAPAGDGTLYTGFLDGRIIQFDPRHPGEYHVRTKTSRPLGMEVHPDGYLVYADAHEGLIRYKPGGTTTKLVSTVNGQPLTLTNDVAISQSGLIYFTESSTKFGLHQLKKDLLEHGGNGRILRFNPSNQSVSVVASGIQFANGLTMSHDGTAVLVSDLGNYRILRYPILENGDLGEPEPVIEALPGMPDNINQGRESGYWIALATPRNTMLDMMAPYPWMRKVVARLPDAMKPAAERHAIVLKIDRNGNVVKNLQDSTGDVALLSTAYPYQGNLYLGSFREPSLRRYSLTN